jgi:predicted nucleic acid-binding protein
VYRRRFEDDRVAFHEEPNDARLDRLFEELSTRSRASTKLWADAYLAAFVRTAGLTPVTFDRALRAVPSGKVEVLG